MEEVYVKSQRTAIAEHAETLEQAIGAGAEHAAAPRSPSRTVPKLPALESRLSEDYSRTLEAPSVPRYRSGEGGDRAGGVSQKVNGEAAGDALHSLAATEAELNDEAAEHVVKSAAAHEKELSPSSGNIESVVPQRRMKQKRNTHPRLRDFRCHCACRRPMPWRP